MRRIHLIGFVLSLLLVVTACQKPSYLPVSPGGRVQNTQSAPQVSKIDGGAASAETTPAAAAPAVKAELAQAEAPQKAPPAGEPQVTQEKGAPAQRELAEPPSKRQAPPPAEPAPKKEGKEAPDKRYVAINFDNADVYDFIQSISEITGINYIVAPGVAGKITVQTTGRIPVEDVLKLMDTILEVYNLAAVKTGDLYKIVTIDQVKKVGQEIMVGREKGAVPAEERVIVQIVKLNYISPGKMLELLQPFLRVHGEAVPFPLMNVLVLIDSASNVRRLLELIDLFDVDLFQNLGVKLYPVQNLIPSDLAKELDQIFSALGISELSTGGGLELIPFDRLSSILVIGTTPALLQSAENWLKELDRPAAAIGMQTYVYYVENGEAPNLASILSQLFVRGERKAAPRAPTPAPTPKPAPTVKEKAKPPTPAPKPAPAPAPELTEVVTGEVRIVADEATNSIIIQATPSDYKIIEKTLKELDLRPKQVLVEVLMAEVTLSKGLDFGVQWTVGHASKRGSTLGTGKWLLNTPTESITDISQFRDFFAALAAGTPGFTYSITSGDELFMLLDALASVTKVDILSSPNILASDNKEAKINVGDEVPIVTSEQLPVGTDVSRFRNIQYRQTGVTLTVTPHVNSKNQVTMNIKQEVSEVAAVTGTEVEQTTPTISTRNVETTIAVQDGQTILLGGLISRNKQELETKFPLLGDIPLLGRLFKTSSDSYRKRELILLITPRVVSTDDEATRLTNEYTSRIKSLKKRMEELRTGKK